MLVLLIGIRKLLDYMFSDKELKVLDDILPASKRTEMLDLEGLIDQEEEKEFSEHPFFEKNSMPNPASGNSLEKLEDENSLPEEDNIIHIKMKGLMSNSNLGFAPDILAVA